MLNLLLFQTSLFIFSEQCHIKKQVDFPKPNSIFQEFSFLYV